MSEISEKKPASAPVRVARALATGLMFVYFFTGGAIFSWIVLPVVNLWMRLRGRSVAQRIRRSQALTGKTYIWFMDAMRWLRLIHFDPREHKLDLTEPSVVIANHPTLIDTPAFLSVNHHLICMAKRSWAQSWFFGRLIRYCGHVEASSAEEALEQARDRLQMGFSILVFPEGQRSPAGGVGKIQRGAFEIARRNGVPLIPVVVTCSPPTLMRGMPWYALPKQTSRYGFKQLPGSADKLLKSKSREAALEFQSAVQHVIQKPPVRSSHNLQL
jgi:1-acyl-sn-glycerol-3-phosphate acyltransferase